MNIQAAKLDLMQKILSVKNVSLLEQIAALLEKEMIVGYTTDGKPLSKKDYNKRLQKAEQQIKSGQFLSQEDFEKEAENW